MYANLSSQELRRAAAIKERIDSLQKELDGLLGGPKIKASAGPRSMSAAARAKIAAAQKVRWAKVRENTKSPAKARRRKMSAVARAKIAAAAKARWAKAKAAGKSSL